MIALGTKAETLRSLKTVLQRSKICDLYVFTVNEWRTNPTACIKTIQANFSRSLVIVRSSAFGEDSLATAMAGVHESIGSVDPKCVSSIQNAVDSVINSYGKHRAIDPERDQVLIQTMITDVSMSGVVFTRDINTGGPYYVINYDDVSGRTDSITSGSDDNRTLIVYRDRLESLTSSRFQKLLAAVKEIEQYVQTSTGLDIEFAVDQSEHVYLFQVRHLTTHKQWLPGLASRVEGALFQIRGFLEGGMRPVPSLLGDRTILGIMPDWNPAEMIGVVPKALAASLYRYLITDSIWAQARTKLGYRDISNTHLMISLGHRVYIDVRASFNSFLPAALPENIGYKLLNYWLDKLDANHELHDKVEFDVLTTVHCLDFSSVVRSQLSSILSKNEIDTFEECLLDLTNNIIASESLIEDLDTYIRRMEAEHSRLKGWCAKSGSLAQLEIIRKMLINCRSNGVLAFSMMARCGFIAESMLRSLVSTDLILAGEAEHFRASVHTVLSDFLEDAKHLKAGDLSRFLETYGHLRPGTYDIESQRYDQREAFLNRTSDSGTEPCNKSKDDSHFQLSSDKCDAIDTVLRKTGYRFDSTELFRFMRIAIAGRESYKLAFTRCLSDAMELIAEWAASHRLSRGDIAHVPIENMFELLYGVNQMSISDFLQKVAEENLQMHTVSQGIRLPFLISQISDVDIIPLLKGRPNFITKKQVNAPIEYLTGKDLNVPLYGRIVLIEGADPGFDWVFLNKIAGLVTKYGGANSHMAIRCAEMGIPAAIGCGEQTFDLLRQGSHALLDCRAEILRPTL